MEEGVQLTMPVFRGALKIKNKQLLDEVEHDIMNYQNRGRLRQTTQTRGFDNS